MVELRKSSAHRLGGRSGAPQPVGILRRATNNRVDRWNQIRGETPRGWRAVGTPWSRGFRPGSELRRPRTTAERLFPLHLQHHSPADRAAALFRRRCTSARQAYPRLIAVAAGIRVENSKLPVPMIVSS
jgi:hypothetical protein